MAEGGSDLGGRVVRVAGDLSSTKECRSGSFNSLRLLRMTDEKDVGRENEEESDFQGF